MKGIGKTYIKKYKEFDILLARHIVGQSDEQKANLISDDIHAKSLDAAINYTLSTASDIYPYPPTNHHHSGNPYQSHL